jgi:hypothetical protein
MSQAELFAGQTNAAMRFGFNDGGRAAAGYKGETGDCVTRAIAIATVLPYQQVYDDLNDLAKTERRGKRKRRISNARTGVYSRTTRKYMASLGWKWVPTMHIGSGCKVHLRADELPPGRLVCKLSKHSAAVIDGVLHDTHDCSRDGTRCVYGYYIQDSQLDERPLCAPFIGRQVVTAHPAAKFIVVHGHDSDTCERLEAVLRELGLQPVRLENPGGGRTIVC